MVYKPKSNVSYAKHTLTYPLFAADWDPYNRGYLVVGGGGGESKTGVPNQISVLDVSHRAAIRTATELKLSDDEDSVQSLANLATKDGLITFAGINSSRAEQNAGKNEHLRSFEITYPLRKKHKTDEDGEGTQGKMELIGKRSVFKTSSAPKNETYQRLLRLSPAKRSEGGYKRVGAIASGMAKDSELIVFNATNATPDDSDIIARLSLDDEANDLDIREPEQSEFSLTYCTDYDLCEQTYKYRFGKNQVEKTPKGPRRVHQMPFPVSTEKPASRPRFRCVRFLNSQNLITLSNKPSKGGADLSIFHLYPTGPATLLLQNTLPPRIKSAVSMDVCALDTDRNGNQQLVVAVASQDISIVIYTLNFNATSETFSKLKPYITLRDVHPQQMTKITFSTFYSPTRAPDCEPPSIDPSDKAAAAAAKKAADEERVQSHPGPQYIRLASISYGKTVVIDTFPLSPLEPKNRDSRYVLSHPSDERFMQGAYIVIISLIVVVAAFLIQSFVTGFSADSGQGRGLFGALPQNVRDFLDRPAAAARPITSGVEKVEYRVAEAVDETLPSKFPGAGRLRSLLRAHDPAGSKALIVRDSPDESSLSVDVHPDKEAYLKENTDAKHWHELTEQQQHRWKERLIRAGEWAEGEGEKVLLGVLFSEWADVVGEMGRAAVAA